MSTVSLSMTSVILPEILSGANRGPPNTGKKDLKIDNML